ncbi:MAG TPA: lysine-2,3-aminomutase-like protein [Candidatus Cybelea sp.]|nr:lysine-2,3-aminomutase-like protein [Candidatus Cybelea sp.]
MPSHSKTLRTAGELVAERLIPPASAHEAEAVAAKFAIAVSGQIADAIDVSDAGDPLARQFLPQTAELHVTPEELADPIGDDAHSPVKGIVHRYPDRVLLKPMHVCPVYCRFCFRREKVGPGGEALTDAELDAALGYVRARPDIWEVILTGGDPFMLSARRLKRILSALDAIPHVGVIRIHTRVPVVDSARVTPSLVAALRTANSAVYVALHCNHARELTPEARAAIRLLADAAIPLLSQTVLLKGVNDDAGTLIALFRALVRLKVKPYYLHHADLARGTAQFRTTIEAGQALMRALRGRLSGLCQPTYVLDIPGGFGKVPAGPAYLRQEHGGRWSIEDWRGCLHAYPGKRLKP